MNQETEKLYATLAALQQELTNMRQGYILVNQRYAQALDSLNALINSTAEAATLAAIAADKAVSEAANEALAARELAAKVVIATAKTAAEAVEEVAQAAADATAAAAKTAEDAANTAKDTAALAIKKISHPDA